MKSTLKEPFRNARDFSLGFAAGLTILPFCFTAGKIGAALPVALLARARTSPATLNGFFPGAAVGVSVCTGGAAFGLLQIISPIKP